MNTITTKLVKDGNSIAVRLPKTALVMSGLTEEILMEVKKGQITLRSNKKNRADWDKKINLVINSNPNVLLTDNELEDWDVTVNEGL